MVSYKAKAILIVFALLLCTGLISVGCKKETKEAWVNTNSMPGNTFVNHTQNSTEKGSSNIVYLENNKPSSDPNFGPRDINFEFKNLK